MVNLTQYSPDFSLSIDALKNSGIRTAHSVVNSTATVLKYISSMTLACHHSH